MKILIRNIDNMVMYADNSMTLTDTELIGNGWRDQHFTTENAILMEAPVPDVFAGNAYTYINEVWTVVDQDALIEPQKIHAAKVREEKKAERARQVAEIKITVNGKIFDGDETSQERMARAIIGMQATGQPAITWVLADNTPTQATLAELTEAMCLAGSAQAAIWVI